MHNDARAYGWMDSRMRSTVITAIAAIISRAAVNKYIAITNEINIDGLTASFSK